MNLIKKFKGLNDTGVLGEADRGVSLFRRELDRAFQRTLRAFERRPWRPFDDVEASSWPAIDVSEDDESFSVRVDVPGLGPKDVEVEVSGNLLTVKGSRQEEREQRDRGQYRHQRFAGSFARSVTLPPSVDMGKIQARYDKGVLTVTAPKVPGVEPRKVPVSA